jgi:hypothetical protein
MQMQMWMNVNWGDGCICAGGYELYLSKLAFLWAWGNLKIFVNRRWAIQSGSSWNR